MLLRRFVANSGRVLPVFRVVSLYCVVLPPGRPHYKAVQDFYGKLSKNQLQKLQNWMALYEPFLGDGFHCMCMCFLVDCFLTKQEAAALEINTLLRVTSSVPYFSTPVFVQRGIPGQTNCIKDKTEEVQDTWVSSAQKNNSTFFWNRTGAISWVTVSIFA